jgi:hypothetical protein
MKTSKSEIILLILLVVIVIIISLTCRKKEGFANNYYFNKDNIVEVIDSIKEEKKLTDEISDIRNYKTENSDRMQYFEKASDGSNNYIGSTDATTSIPISPRMDTKKIIDYNNEIRDELETVNFDNLYKDVIKDALNNIAKMNEQKTALDSDLSNKLQSSPAKKCLTITNDNILKFYDCNLLDNQRWEEVISDTDTDTDKKLFIKNPFTSKTLYLEKKRPDVDVDVDNHYIYKYNDSDNENNGDNCNANQKQIILEKKTVTLDKKCINMNGAPFLSECPDDNKLNYYKIDDKKNYIKTYNKDITSNNVFHIKANNVDKLPKKFSYFIHVQQ